MPRCWSFTVYKQCSNLQPVYSPSPRKKSRKGISCTQSINLFTVIIFGDSTFTTDEINAYLLIHLVLAVSSDFSPSFLMTGLSLKVSSLTFLKMAFFISLLCVRCVNTLRNASLANT